MYKDFIPVLLGSDVNVYGMARSFHQEYGVKSLAIGKGSLNATANSKIISVEVIEPELEDDEVFCRTLIDFAGRYTQLPLLLVPCGDNYIKLLVRNQDKIKDYYRFECIDEELLMRLSIKKNFYEVCEEHGFEFPQTSSCTYENYEDFESEFGYPLVIKPSNSVAYWNCTFPHKKKVFVAADKEETDKILKAIYSSSYKDALILQEYIPGEDSQMRVMNCYCGSDKKVRLISLGNALLEEHTPEGIGSYAAIINGYDAELSEKMRLFLEAIGYVGWANFDMKLDPRDGKYKLFEMNLRQGRSSFYVTAGGYNMAKFIVDDVIYNKPHDLIIAEEKVLWTIIPKSVIFKYVRDDEIKAEARKLIKNGKICNSLYYNKDRGFKRTLMFILNQINYIRKYKQSFGNKGLR